MTLQPTTTFSNADQYLLHTLNAVLIVNMKATLIISSALVALAAAKPILEEKRYLVTEVVQETATVTITASRGWRNWGRPSDTASNVVSVISTRSSSIISSSSSKSSTTPQSTTTTVVVVTTSASPSSSSRVPTPSSSVAASSNSATPQPSQSVGSGSVSSYADPIISQHNIHRYNHSAPDIQWNTTLANTAMKIAQSCVYAHNSNTDGGNYGQNIGAGAPPTEIDKMITNSMYNDEMMLYPGYGSEPSMNDFHSWGHFSQIVWKETVSVGCYTQHCPGGLANVGSNVSPYFTVCNYYPAGKLLSSRSQFNFANCLTGNFQSQYAKNVLNPQGHPVVSL